MRKCCDHQHAPEIRQNIGAIEGIFDDAEQIVLEWVQHHFDTGAIMTPLIYVLNGPNLNLLGKRQPHIYGHETLADVEADCRKLAGSLGLDMRFHQSNREYEIIDWVHEARETASGIVINPAAFTHTSVAILDALNAFDHPIIEVHISNVHKREEFRHHSFISPIASGVIAGFGTQGYQLAIQRLATLIKSAKA